MKRLVIDARESGTSTGRYIDKLLEHLQALHPKFEVIVLAKPHRVGYIRRVAPSFEVRETPYKEFSFGEQFGFKQQLKALRADLVHFGMVQQPALYRGKTVTTINDLTTARFYNPAKNRFLFALKQSVYRWLNKRVARQADALITYTQYVKDDIVDFAGISPDKVTVVYLGADRIEEPAEPLKTLEKQPFIMYVGRPTPHKNLERLIAAFQRLQAARPELRLVLAGKKDANYERVQALVERRGISNVVFTDFVTEGQLRWLYEHCAAYVFPSLSEGFGLPGLEAMAHGAPVVSSSGTCLPEVYGDAAHYFDPENVESIADAINEVLTDKKLCAALIKQGELRVKQFSWQQTAEQTLAVYQQILQQ